MDATKLDQLCDFSRHEREVEKYRKFEGDVSPNSTFAVDDNWRMVPLRDLYPQRFNGIDRSRDSGQASGRRYHVSVPRKVIEESKFRLVKGTQNKHDSFSLMSHVQL